MSRKFGAFDPASTASTTVTTEVVDTSSVVLYLPFDEDIQDDSGVGTSMTAVGNAFVQSSLTQFGAKALYLDGSGDYLQSVQKSSANSIFTLSSAAFTIDGWLYPQTFNEVISNFNASNPFAGFTASMNFSPHAAGKLAFFTSDGSAYDTSMASSTAFALNQWSHFAIVRGAISANSLEFFINGVKHGSHTVTREPGTSNNVVRIGASNNSQPNRQFKGAMDDLRIIKGVALYSTNFSVPTTAVGNFITTSSSTENTRTHSHVWNYPDIYKARRADTWPPLVVTETITFKVWGAGGGGTNVDGSNSRRGAGGAGGFAQGTVTAAHGTEFLLTVGSGGPHTTSSNRQPIAAGTYGGGGAGYAEEQDGGAGGGFSGVFTGSRTQANAIIIAGGGGGGETGRDGKNGNPGDGGSQSSGGAGGGGNATDGSALQGGNGGNKGPGQNRAGAGGGGGYYGGGGGGAQNNGGDGGGGSGYVGGNSSYTPSSTTNTQGGDGVNGQSSSATGGSPPNSSDSDYVTNAARGGGADQSGYDGAIVVIVGETTTVYSSAGEFTFTVS